MKINANQTNTDFGCAMLLYSKSSLHASWRIDVAANYILSALLSRQYLLLKSEEGVPLGFASWAFLDLEREAQYLKDPHSLKFADWSSGDRLWFMDCASPIGSEVTAKMLMHLRGSVFPNSVARALRLKPGEKIAKIKSYGGFNVSPQMRSTLLKDYYFSIKGYMNGVDCKVDFGFSP